MNEMIAVNPDHPEEFVLQRAVEIVQKGGLIVYPTETLYGIGADAMNPVAIRKISGAKQRKEDKPILVIVDSQKTALSLVVDVNDEAKLLMEKFWPGPLTLVFKSSSRVPSELTQGSGTIGIRIPSNIFCKQLLSRLGIPLTSTSANLAGELPLRSIDGSKRLKGIDLFIDAGELRESLPSTVVDVSSGVPRLLRKGAVPVEQISRVIPNIQSTDRIR